MVEMTFVHNGSWKKKGRRTELSWMLSVDTFNNLLSLTGVFWGSLISKKDHWPSVSPLASSSLVGLHLCLAFLSSSLSWSLFSSLHLLPSCWHSSSFSSRWSSWAVRDLCQHLLSSLSNRWSNHCKYKQIRHIQYLWIWLMYVYKDCQIYGTVSYEVWGQCTFTWSCCYHQARVLFPLFPLSLHLMILYLEVLLLFLPKNQQV